MKRILLMSFLLLGLITSAWAQRAVTGKVMADGGSLPGVAVKLKGTAQGTVTDMDGNYRVEVPSDDAVLVFSFIGYTSKEVTVGSQSVINVQLSEDVQQLQEVVVVAYGTANKGSFTGSASEIKSASIAQRPVTNVASAISGQAAGVQTTAGSGQPGDGPAIRIRGFGSANSSSAPLYVVDGVPYDGNISNIDPNDIESISILKDASSAALYGSRAANGVVMITTKKGKKNNAQVNFRASKGVSTRGLAEYDRVDAFQYYPLIWESHRNSLISTGIEPEVAAQRATDEVKGILGYNPFNVADNEIVGTDGKINPDAQLLYADDLDWSDAISRTGNRSDYGLSVSGGSDKSDYYISMGYLSDKGFTLKTDYERFTGRLNLNTQATDWFKTGLNISGTLSKSNQARDGSSSAYVNPFNFTRNMGPIYPIHVHDPATGEYVLDENGNKIFDFLGQRGAGASTGRHVIAETMWNDDLFKRNVLSARTYGEISFLKDFKFTTNMSVDVSNYLASTYDNNQVGDGAPAGRAGRTSTLTTSYTFNQLLTYAKTFNRHFVEVLAGHENYDMTYNYLYGFRQGVIVEGNTELGNFTTTNRLDSRTDRHRIESYLSRINYTFGDKYTVTTSYRRDGSSKFGADVRWGDFWSLGASWRLDKEGFMTMPNWVNMLKLRGSYGQVGNDGILNDNGSSIYYAYQALYGIGFNNAAEPGFLQQTLASPNLLWEANNTLDVGLDFNLFNRINGSIDYFHRESDNLLFQVPLSLTTGIETIAKNSGTMFNRGVELHIGADVVKAGDFNWNVDLNWTTFKNEFTKLPQEEIINGSKKYMVGQSIYDFWLRDWYGVDPADGAALYVADDLDDEDNRTINGVIVTPKANNAKFHYAGTAIPDFAGGITNTLRYKDFTLSGLLTYSVGGKTYDVTYASLMSSGPEGNALHVDALNRWQKEGDVTDVPRMDRKSTVNFNAASDRWLVSATNMNIRSVTLSYLLPKSLASKAHMQNASIYLTGENLGFFSARKGMNVGQNFSGVTSNAYMPARIVTLGLNVML